MQTLGAHMCLHNTHDSVNTAATENGLHIRRNSVNRKNVFTYHNTQCKQICKHMLSTQHDEQCKHRFCLHCTTQSVNYGLQNSRPPRRPTNKFKMIGSTGPTGVAVLCAAQSQTARSWAVSLRATGGNTPYPGGVLTGF